MNKFFALFFIAFAVACSNESATETASESATAEAEFSVSDAGVKTKNVEGFGGIIAESYNDSREWWPEEERPNADAPNVIIFLLDDVGFAQVGSFGALIDTPNIDRLAANLTSSRPTLETCRTVRKLIMWEITRRNFVNSAMSSLQCVC